jgi:hypothetical protein
MAALGGLLRASSLPGSDGTASKADMMLIYRVLFTRTSDFLQERYRAFYGGVKSG